MNVAHKMQPKAQARVDADANPFRVDDRPLEVFQRRYRQVALDSIWSLPALTSNRTAYRVREVGIAFFEAQRPRRKEDDSIGYPHPTLHKVIEREFWIAAALRHADRGLWRRVRAVRAGHTLAGTFGLWMLLALVTPSTVALACAVLGPLALRVVVCAREMFDTRALAVRLTREVQRVHGPYYEKADAERFKFAPKADHPEPVSPVV